MKSLRTFLFATLALAAVVFALCLLPSVAIAQEPVATSETAGAEVADLLSSISANLPSWVLPALSIFAIVSNFYQLVIAFAHKQAAETSTPLDNEWIAKLEAKWWFRVLDRVFYWGGYVGAKLGGKKL